MVINITAAAWAKMKSRIKSWNRNVTLDKILAKTGSRMLEKPAKKLNKLARPAPFNSILFGGASLFLTDENILKNNISLVMN